MKEAFEKILERLEEPKFDIGCGECPYMEKCDEVQETITNEKTDLCAETMRAIAKEIVLEVAEEFATDTNVGTNGWIPCSERLPKEDGSYLVQSVFEEEVHFYDQYYDSGCEAFGTYSDYYDKNTLGFLDSEFVKDEYVVAWQPLPEPYKESDE